jgi:hypothetical protein
MAFTDIARLNPAVIVAVAFAEPPSPEQLRTKSLGPGFDAATFEFPVACFEPDHAPLAVHAVASVDDQVSVADCPRTVVAGLTEIDTVGGAGTRRFRGWLPLPPAPVHWTV